LIFQSIQQVFRTPQRGLGPGVGVRVDARINEDFLDLFVREGPQGEPIPPI